MWLLALASVTGIATHSLYQETGCIASEQCAIKLLNALIKLQTTQELHISGSICYSSTILGPLRMSILHFNQIILYQYFAIVCDLLMVKVLV